MGTRFTLSHKRQEFRTVLAKSIPTYRQYYGKDTYEGILSAGTWVKCIRPNAPVKSGYVDRLDGAWFFLAHVGGKWVWRWAESEPVTERREVL